MPNIKITWIATALLVMAVAIAMAPAYFPATATHSQSYFTVRKQYDVLASLTPWHFNVVTTVFWTGEPADSDNGDIPNAESAWDDHWQLHYGGFDNPDRRQGYRPAGFTPHENPFYIALPYNDIAPDDSRKSSAAVCRALTPTLTPDHSWCKNVWIAVSYHGRTAYAQWEDAGPFGEDDAQYVFNGLPPSSLTGEKAGLDVSPGVRDYLGIGDVSMTTWHFAAPTDVPGGPWTARITASHGYTIE